jgi:hypothetical protein
LAAGPFQELETLLLLLLIVAVIVGTAAWAYIDAPNARTLPPPHRRQKEW